MILPDRDDTLGDRRIVVDFYASLTFDTFSDAPGSARAVAGDLSLPNR
ncbi:hypothetical protein GFS60_06654 (plasmid) [Rhodococcus sp. WAY2]|nr:hypothetical protein GFS60_06654 [Rhodococcus sp. WAY2]